MQRCICRGAAEVQRCRGAGAEVSVQGFRGAECRHRGAEDSAGAGAEVQRCRYGGVRCEVLSRWC